MQLVMIGSPVGKADDAKLGLLIRELLNLGNILKVE